jgi:hypothetical protein
MQLILTPSDNPTYGSFQVGDKVRCLQGTNFIDGPIHLKGAIYTVKKESLSYFNVMFRNYELI